MVVTTIKIIIAAFIIIFYLLQSWVVPLVMISPSPTTSVTSELNWKKSFEVEKRNLCRIVKYDWNQNTAHPSIYIWNQMFQIQLVSDTATFFLARVNVNMDAMINMIWGLHYSSPLISNRFWLSNTAQCGCWPHENANCITGQSLVSAALSVTCTFTHSSLTYWTTDLVTQSNNHTETSTNKVCNYEKSSSPFGT